MDESKCYNEIKEHGYCHHFINHSECEFVNEEGITTNTIEGFWEYFKRMVFGIYHFISPKNVQRYIDEAVYRWNTRKETEEGKFCHMFSLSLGIFDYRSIRMEFC